MSDGNGGGGGDYRAELARQAEIRKREKALKDAGFREMLTEGGQAGKSKYVNTKTGKTAGYAGAPIDITKGKLTDYGRGSDEVISLKTLRSMSGVPEPRATPKPTPKTKTSSKPATKVTNQQTTISEETDNPSTSRRRPGFADGGPDDPITGGSGYYTPDHSSDTARADSVVKSPVQPVQLATLTDEMDLTNKLTEIINTNSPLFKAAQTKALQAMQSRGILNSSLAQEAVMNSILNVALPIAQEEVQALQQNLYYNTDWTNKQKQQANEFYYNKILTRLQGKINYQLQQMVQSYAAWGKYGDWITQIITQEGADQDAWKRMLDAIKAAGGWPQLPKFGVNPNV